MSFPRKAGHCCMDRKTYSMSSRGLTTGSKKQLKILTILVF
ncbi:palindromic element RPE4 domain-containing protein [Rickettsia sp.]